MMTFATHWYRQPNIPDRAELLAMILAPLVVARWAARRRWQMLRDAYAAMMVAAAFAFMGRRRRYRRLGHDIDVGPGWLWRHIQLSLRQLRNGGNMIIMGETPGFNYDYEWPDERLQNQ